MELQLPGYLFHPPWIRNADTPTPTGVHEQITITPTIWPEATDGLLGKPLIIQMLFGGEIYLQDVNTGETRSINPELYISDAYFLGWTRQGCGFYLYLDNADIVEVDLRGDICVQFSPIKTCLRLKSMELRLGLSYLHPKLMLP